MTVLISNHQSAYQVAQETIQKTAETILNVLGCKNFELSLVIVDDADIADLNKKFLNRTGPTNVIAFPMQEGNFSGINPDLLGDVVISINTTEKEALSGKVSIGFRFTELLVHGILHLLGYDHETNEKDAMEMEEKSRFIMNFLEKKGLIASAFSKSPRLS